MASTTAGVLSVDTTVGAPRQRVALVAVGVVAAAQLLAIAIFDLLAGALPLNDDWVYAWSARRLAEGHGLHLFPEQSVPALPQVLLGTLGLLVHPGNISLRLETLVFAGLAAGLVVLLSRQLGASEFWSLVAGAAFLAFPVFSSVTTSFMTEPVYLDLLLLGAAVAAHFFDTGRGGWLLPAIVLVSVLDRQHALGLPAALTLVLVVSLRGRVGARNVALLAACCFAALAALLIPGLLHLSTAKMTFRATTAFHPSATLALATAAYTPGVVGLLALPFAGVLGRVALGGGSDRRVGMVVAAAVGWCAVAVAATFVFPGNYLTVAGLGPVTVPGSKPPLLAAVLPALKVAGLGAFVAVIAALYRRRSRLSAAAAFLLVLAITQAVPILTFAIYDRYFLPLLALLLPFLARAASSTNLRRVDAAWATAALVLLSALYVVGEQDYLSWQMARDRLAREVMAAAPASSFWPGYEPYGVLRVVPRFEQGRDIGITGANLPSSDGPANPALVLVITERSDPRPGLGYSSLVPGRIVLECRRGPCPTLPSQR
ncbi:MAG: hypothetical protein ACR2MY_14165 [Candidatus Dormibacteria bacterium]